MYDSLAPGRPEEMIKILESEGLPVPQILFAMVNGNKAKHGLSYGAPGKDEFTDGFGRDGFRSPALEAKWKETGNIKRAYNKPGEKGDR